MQLCQGEHFYNIFLLTFVIAEYNNNRAQKWGQICWKSVQLSRVAFFQSDFFQNWYFSISLVLTQFTSWKQCSGGPAKNLHGVGIGSLSKILAVNILGCQLGNISGSKITIIKPILALLLLLISSNADL